MDDVSLNDIKRIVETIKDSRDLDFSNYAFSSFRRRIIRFTEINRIQNIDLLIDKIKNDSIYFENLVESITVNVTEMFRDPTFWITLRSIVLPELSTRSEIKIWHAACSTGEEVFSMAVLLNEAGLLSKTGILATDINRNVLHAAEKGRYSLKKQGTNDKNYSLLHCGQKELSEYYKIEGGEVQFDTGLIANVEFRQLDLTKDEPHAVFDLVLCRNVLIYFNSDLQEHVLSTINKSMNPGSFLAIGSRESIRWCREYNCFSEENDEEKIYRKISERRMGRRAII